MKKHIISDLVFPDDAHILDEKCDFSVLDNLYEGRKAYYGDFHCHSNSGGTSDGKMSLSSWISGMKEQKMDFAGIMDHKQVRHMYLEDYDPEFFVYGTEPGGRWSDKELSFHYLMIFPERDSLIKVLRQFPDEYNFTGDELEGSYSYIRMEKDRFLEVVKAVRNEGGVVVHAHPKQVMKSEDPNDFYFGEGSVIETIYTCDPPALSNKSTADNYKLWMDMLDIGYKVINTATNDSHRQPMNIALNTVYSDEKKGPAYVKYLRAGDLNAGFIGIKMSIDSTPVGSTVKYYEGMKLYIKIDDAHPQRFDKDESYRLDIITDKGLAYSEKITMPYKIALNVENRRFYRAVIIRESDGAPAAIGNPIWINA